jgi:hypothetical protein
VLFASLITVANVLNADAKELIAETQAMGAKAFMTLVNYQPAEVLALAA